MYRKIVFCIAINFFILMHTTLFSQENHCALLVGINNYSAQEGIDCLEHSIRSCTIYKNALVKFHGWDPGNIKILTDRYAKRSDIKEHIKGPWKYLNPCPGQIDHFIFHFSGHGNGVSGSIFPYEGDEIVYNDIQNWIESFNYVKSSVSIDACYSGGFPENMTTDGIICSGTDNELGRQPDELRAGVLSYYLKKGLSEPRYETYGKFYQADLNKDNLVLGWELFTYATDSAKAWYLRNNYDVYPKKAKNNYNTTMTYTYVEPPDPPSLNVSNISGPSQLNYLENGTFAVNAEGGVNPRTYQWYEMVMGGAGGQGMILDGGIGIDAEQGEWLAVGENSPTLNIAETQDFKLKVEVTDYLDNLVTSNEHYVIVIGPKRAIAGGNVPKNYNLSQNYPNPFNPETKIKYALPEPSKVSIKVYDVAGREVANLTEGNKSAGYHTVKWNAKDLPSGIYICRMKAGRFTDVIKMSLVK